MPSSPTSERVETWRTSPLQTSPSGVRTSTSTMCSAATVGALRCRAGFGVLEDLVDRALHVEGALGEVVVLAVEDLAEAANGLGNRHVLAGTAGELFGDEERLRE